MYNALVALARRFAELPPPAAPASSATDRHHPAGAVRTRNGLILSTVLLVALAYLLYQLFVDFSLGGNSWKQGDWLINELSGPIRRGLFGSGLIHIADVFGWSPLALLIALQALMVFLIFAVLGVAALELRVPDKLLLILLSPGFLVLFWFNDPQGSVRKELLVYVAFLPLLVAAMRGRGERLACVLSGLAYAMAVAAHEGTVFFLPFLWVGMWLIMPRDASIALRLGVVVASGLLAFGGGLYAALNTHLADSGRICAQLVSRGLDPGVCDGAIAYLQSTPDEARMNPTRLFSDHFRSFLLIYAACLLSFRVLLQGSPRLEAWFVAVVASGLVFFPLYILAGDYGRWLNYHVSSLTFIALIMLLKWRPHWLYDSPRPLDFLCLLAMNMIIGVSHSPGEMTEGFIVSVVRLVLT